MRCWLCVVAAVAAAAPPVAEKKLLYPIMIQGGPNNQYQQFLESMVLAKALRRKIVLAPFLSWPGGGDRQRVHAFGATFDVDAVKKFVDVVSTKEMGEASTTIVSAGGAKRPKHELSVICGMAGIRGGWCATQATSTPLLTPAARQRCRTREKTWGSFARCLSDHDDRVLGAALWASMNGLYGQRALRKPRTLQAVRALRRAPAIRDQAATLRRTLFGDRPYLCAHVRRVENAQRCRDGGSVRAPQVSCPPMKAGYVATRRLAETLRTAATAAGVADVYISRVALRQGPFRSEGAALLGFLRNGSNAVSGAVVGDDNYVASLVEQEMCERAAAFVGTADSTWTSLVAHQRFARGENCSTSFEQLLSRQPRVNLNMPQGLVARELLARGVEDFRRRCDVSV
jgi:hypothetical protein